MFGKEKVKIQIQIFFVAEIKKKTHHYSLLAVEYLVPVSEPIWD